LKPNKKGVCKDDFIQKGVDAKTGAHWIKSVDARKCKRNFFVYVAHPRQNVKPGSAFYPNNLGEVLLKEDISL
jgi:hypothetical protein